MRPLRRMPGFRCRRPRQKEFMEIMNEILEKVANTWRLGNEALKVNANKGVFLRRSYLTKKEVRRDKQSDDN